MQSSTLSMEVFTYPDRRMNSAEEITYQVTDSCVLNVTVTIFLERMQTTDKNRPNLPGNVPSTDFPLFRNGKGL